MWTSAIGFREAQKEHNRHLAQSQKETFLLWCTWAYAAGLVESAN